MKRFPSAVIPAKAGIQGPQGEQLANGPWTPAFAGVTE
jgi:hypothetical protein